MNALKIFVHQLKKEFIDLYKNYKYFISLNTCFLIIGSWILIKFSNIDITLWLNDLHGNHFIDHIILYLTNFGDIKLIIPYIIAIFIYDLKSCQKRFINLQYLIITFVVVTGVTQSIKYVFRSHRPIYVFNHFYPNIRLNIIENNLPENYSFPSGHSVFMMLSIILTIYIFNIKNKYTQTLLSLFCIFVSLTRMFLFYHFFRDIYCGYFIGFIFTFITIGFYNVILKNYYNKYDN